MELPRSIEEAARSLRSAELTCTRLVRAYLARSEELQPKLNAFVTLTPDWALARAQALDEELRAGADRGPLHGIPVVYKDCLDTAGVRTTMASRLFAQRIAAADAEVVQRLSAAGAVMLGKTNMNEFAAGTSGKNAAFGDVRNPRALDRSAGGSSSGTAAAVAAGLALGGVGTDTGGSIRIPAACTGTVGLRPTPGRIPLGGCFPRAPSLDVVAPLAATARDCAVLFAAMAAGNAARLDDDVAGTRIGVIRDYSLLGLDAEVEHAVRTALDALAAAGAALLEVDVPVLQGNAFAQAFLDIMLYEFHQVLGEHWRGRTDRDELFGPMVRANLERGAKLTLAGYRAALAARDSGAAAIRAVFSRVDVLATPVLPMLTPALDAPPELFDRERHFMSPFSLAGLPAISVPCGASRDGLPIGLQFIADRLQEESLFRIAQRLPQRL